MNESRPATEGGTCNVLTVHRVVRRWSKTASGVTECKEGGGMRGGGRWAGGGGGVGGGGTVMPRQVQ